MQVTQAETQTNRRGFKSDSRRFEVEGKTKFPAVVEYFKQSCFP